MKTHPKPLELCTYKNIVILTGAGISVASGLRTYRGPNGMWEEGDVERLSHIDTFVEEPDSAWQFYGALRQAIAPAEPNAAHQALSALEANLNGDQKMVLITQNVDGLHQKAGSTRVVEMHGGIYRTRCSNQACSAAPFTDRGFYETAPLCQRCNAVLRPDIVLFGEMIPADADWTIRRSLRNCDLFLSIGTSGTVSPACDFVRSAKYAGAKTILVNPEEVPLQGAFDLHIAAAAEESLAKLFGTEG